MARSIVIADECLWSESRNLNFSLRPTQPSSSRHLSIGTLLGNLVGALLRTVLTDEQLYRSVQVTVVPSAAEYPRASLGCAASVGGFLFGRVC